jgi:hypothetical protein
MTLPCKELARHPKHTSDPSQNPFKKAKENLTLILTPSSTQYSTTFYPKSFQYATRQRPHESWIRTCVPIGNQASIATWWPTPWWWGTGCWWSPPITLVSAIRDQSTIAWRQTCWDWSPWGTRLQWTLSRWTLFPSFGSTIIVFPSSLVTYIWAKPGSKITADARRSSTWTHTVAKAARVVLAAGPAHWTTAWTQTSAGTPSVSVETNTIIRVLSTLDSGWLLYSSDKFSWQHK